MFLKIFLFPSIILSLPLINFCRWKLNLCVGGLVTKSWPTLVTPWTVVGQAPLPIGYFRQEYWSGLSFLSPRDLPNPGIKPRSPALQADSIPTELWGKPWNYFTIDLVKVAQLCLTLSDPMDYTDRMELSRPEYWSG